VSFSQFIEACAKQPVNHIPVWYMRQAGRYQPEYREIRKKHSLLDICRIPELCYEVTKLPVDQLNVDAAILFSDIMVPVGAMGLNFDIQENIGPVVEHPISSLADVDRLRVFDPEESLPYVLDSVRLLKQNLDVPLIGFSGAPYTLAYYMIEGKSPKTRNYLKTKQMMWGQPEIWTALMDKLADAITGYLRAQVAAGAAAVQLFDSWVGSLAPDDFREFVLPTVKKIFTGLQDLGVPLIYFGVDTSELLPAFTETGATVIGIDWRVPIPTAREKIGGDFALQGNLDPALLLAPWPVLEDKARKILDAGMAREGFIFNLGHGVIHTNPPVEIETLRRLTEFVHDYSRDRLAQRRV
jgi:uroporphyrinogen decarboxylase